MTEPAAVTTENYVVYYPLGKTRIEDGSEIHNRDLALDVARSLRTGHDLAIPNLRDADGLPRWRVERIGAADWLQGHVARILGAYEGLVRKRGNHDYSELLEKSLAALRREYRARNPGENLD